MKKRIVSSLLILLLCSCTTKKDFSKVYSIDELSKTEKTINFSELKSDVEYINLETTPESLFSEAYRVIYSPQFIYILSHNPNKVRQFTHDGRFVRTISCQGKSGREYIFANDMYVDSKNDRLFIDDMGGGKILEYDCDGNFINTRKVGQYVLKSYLMDGDYLYESSQVVFGNEPYKLIVKNQSGDTVSSHVNNIRYKLSGNSVGYNDTKSLFKFNNDIVYHQMSSDTVYTYNPLTHNLDVRYVFKNPKPLTAEDYEQLSERISQFTLIKEIAESDKYIYVTLLVKNFNKSLYLIDKETGAFYKADFMLKKSQNKGIADVKFFPKWQSENVLIDCVQLDEQLNPCIVLIKPKTK